MQSWELDALEFDLCCARDHYRDVLRARGRRRQEIAESIHYYLGWNGWQHTTERAWIVVSHARDLHPTTWDAVDVSELLTTDDVTALVTVLHRRRLRCWLTRVDDDFPMVPLIPGALGERSR